VVAWKNLWGREIEDLQKRLDGYRLQLHVLLVVTLREEIQRNNSKFDHLFQRNECVGESFLKHITEIEKWRVDILDAIRESHQRNASIDDGSKPTDYMLQSCSKKMAQSFVQRVLRSLHFREMPDRKKRIPIRHQETYEWIFRESSGTVHWDSFVDWLKGPSSIYWLTGKPGYAKSTLTKFVLGDPRTRRMLESCSDSKTDTLIVSGSFFWNSGAPLQMSQLGLIKTLLYECIERCPDLVPSILPH
jgi:hypothetical protein